MSTVNKERFNFLFLIWMPFISLSCLITLSVIASMLNTSNESGHFVLFLIFTVNHSVLHH